MTLLDRIEAFKKGLEKETGFKVNVDIGFTDVPKDKMPEGSEKKYGDYVKADYYYHTDKPSRGIIVSHMSELNSLGER